MIKENHHFDNCVHEKQLSKYTYLVGLMLLLVSTYSNSQTNVQGIQGLTFEQKAQNYLQQVQDTFDLHGMKIVPNGLVLKWLNETKEFHLYGAAEIILSEEKIYASLGTEDTPGLIVKDDVLDEVVFGITTGFDLKGLSLHPDSLTFLWNKNEGKYEMFGELDIGIEGDTLDVLLGSQEDPGVEVVDGVVDKINIGITDDFELKSLKFAPDELTFHWDKEENTYEIFGSVELDIAGDSLQADLGSDEKSGIKIHKGIIEHISIGVTDDFELKSLRFAPDNLTFEYDREENDFDIYGSVELDIEGDSIKAILGDENNPGIEIKGGEIDKIDVGVTEDFKLKGLEIKTDSLGFAWHKEKSGDVFHMFGKVDLDIEGREIGFSFGSFGEPGLVYENGKITSYEIGTSEDLFFGGLEVKTEDFTVEHHQNEYHVTGKMAVKELWSAIIDLGENPGSGVTLETGEHTKFDIDKASFVLAGVNLGAIDIKTIKLTITNDKISEVDAVLKFPPGWEVGGDFIFQNGDLHSIEVEWSTKKIEDAIEIPGTGAEIVMIKGKVENFDDPHNFSFNGNMGVAMGGPFVIDGTEVSIVYIETGVTLNRNELILHSDVEVGAYMDSKGNWHSILGDGKLKLDLKWGNIYTLSGDLNVPGGDNAIITAELDLSLSNSGAFNGRVEVELEVPHSIPLIGGHKFGEADGAVHYDKTDPSSFAAGWVEVDLWFKTIKKGVKYNFKKKDFTTIGAHSIKKLQKIHSEEPAQNSETYWDKMHLTVDEDDRPHFIQYEVKFKKSLSKVMTDVWSKAYTSHYAPCYYVDGVDLLAEDRMNVKMVTSHTYLWSYNIDSVIFYVLPIGYDTDISARLAPGDYMLEVGTPDMKGAIESVQIHKYYEGPKVKNINASGKFVPTQRYNGEISELVKDYEVTFDMDIWVIKPDSAKINYYIYDRDNGREIMLKRVLFNDVVDKKLDHGYYSTSTTFIVDKLYNDEDYTEVYAVVDDGVNPVNWSNYQDIYLPGYCCSDSSLFVHGEIWDNCPDSKWHQTQYDEMGCPLKSGLKINLLVEKNNKWYSVSRNDIYSGKWGSFRMINQIAEGTNVKWDISIPYGSHVPEDMNRFFPGKVFINDLNWEGTLKVNDLNMMIQKKETE